MIETDIDWSFSIAYNAVLQACRAYMFRKGYRPSGIETHKTVFEFMQLTVPREVKTTAAYFDRVRKKRHRAVYDERGIITRKEAETIVAAAKDFVSYVEGKIRR